jgi:hypothetical protein
MECLICKKFMKQPYARIGNSGVCDRACWMLFKLKRNEQQLALMSSHIGDHHEGESDIRWKTRD